jgi:hypothetical protein
MPTTFYGKWSLDVTGNVDEFGQRVRIQGSLNADGDLAAAVGAQIAEIDGADWEVYLERSSDGGATWQENLVQRIPTVTPQNGLTVTLYGDDSVVPPQESDVTVQFVYLNRQVNPQPVPPPFSFTLPPGSFWPQRPPPLCECCCKAPCCCRPGALKGKRRVCC